MLNPFSNSDAFNMAALTKAINLLPNNYGRIRNMRLMPPRGVRARTVLIEEKNGVLNLLPTQPVGSPGTMDKKGKRTLRSIVIPHIPHDSTILPDEYEGIRAFGSETELDTLAGIVNDHQQRMRNKHSITLEHLRMGALKGIVLDSDTSILHNFYTEFGITPKTVDWKFTVATTDIAALCRTVLRHIEDNLQGEVMSNVHCLVSSGFFDKLISHALVKEIFLNHVAAIDRLGGDPRKEFQFGGLTFEEYRGTATDADGNARPFIAADEGHAFPLGTMDTFETLFAPADFLETVNTLGLEIYSKQVERKFGRGIDLHTQSNPLPICYRPGVLVKFTVS